MIFDDAHAQRRLVQHDGPGEPAARRGDDHRQGGGDEQRVADPPAGPEPDDLADRGLGPGQRAEQPAPRSGGGAHPMKSLIYEIIAAAGTLDSGGQTILRPFGLTPGKPVGDPATV